MDAYLEETYMVEPSNRAWMKTVNGEAMLGNTISPMVPKKVKFSNALAGTTVFDTKCTL